MAQPTWVTDSGSLGTIPEGKFYRAILQAYDSDSPNDALAVKFVKLSGDLPPGMQIRENGIIEGTPQTYVKGVPFAVSKNITSKFSVRSYTQKIDNGSYVIDELNDRTFTLTVTGQDEPQFITPTGSLGQFYDGQLVNIQIEYEDDDPDDIVVMSLANGELPPGVTISRSGLLYGYIDPTDDISVATDGWEQVPWENYPWQFNQGTLSKNYEFTLKITDGKTSNIRTYSIFVGLLTADTTNFTADNSLVRVDAVARAPYLENYVEDLGSFKHNNYFIYKFEGADHVGDILNYSYSGTLPSGLTLDSETGFLYGELDSIGTNVTEYTFYITVYKKEETTSSTTYKHRITINGQLNETVNWITDTNLGTIDNGQLSLFNIEAESTTGVLKYKLKTSDTYNKLPDGLTLNESGNIVGNVSYNTFRLVDRKITTDSSSTVDTTLVRADENGQNQITFDNGTTTIDKKYVFTVQAYNDAGTISTTKQFEITVNRKYDIPTNDICVHGHLIQSDRDKINLLLEDTDIFPTDSIYRSDDPYFGIAQDLTYTHLYGLSPENLDHYTEALAKHYDKDLILGKIKTAVAKDSDGNVIYEVIYAEIIDDILNISEEVTTSVGTVYPNSLGNLRNQVIEKIGKVDEFLPRWMTSVQSDGAILGYVPAWVIAYTKPNKSNSILYNINEDYIYNLNAINFKVDRYILNQQKTRFWNTDDQRWPTYVSTTFDIYKHLYSVDSEEILVDSTSYTADQFNSSSTQTTFDKKSLQFIEPRPVTTDDINISANTINITTDGGYVDYKKYTKTSLFDNYLLFPKKDIINSK